MLVGSARLVSRAQQTSELVYCCVTLCRVRLSGYSQYFCVPLSDVGYQDASMTQGIIAVSGAELWLHAAGWQASIRAPGEEAVSLAAAAYTVALKVQGSPGPTLKAWTLRPLRLLICRTLVSNISPVIRGSMDASEGCYVILERFRASNLRAGGQAGVSYLSMAMSPTASVVLPTPLLVPATTRTLQGSTAMAGPDWPLLGAELCCWLCLATSSHPRSAVVCLVLAADTFRRADQAAAKTSLVLAGGNKGPEQEESCSGSTPLELFHALAILLCAHTAFCLLSLGRASCCKGA